MSAVARFELGEASAAIAHWKQYAGSKLSNDAAMLQGVDLDDVDFLAKRQGAGSPRAAPNKFGSSSAWSIRIGTYRLFVNLGGRLGDVLVKSLNVPGRPVSPKRAPRSCG
jgi:hypothetical protein